MDNNLEHIDQLFSNQLSGDKITPPADVWAGVQAGLTAKATVAATAKGLLAKWIIGAAVGIAGISSAVYFIGAKSETNAVVNYAQVKTTEQESPEIVANNKENKTENKVENSIDSKTRNYNGNTTKANDLVNSSTNESQIVIPNNGISYSQTGSPRIPDLGKATEGNAGPSNVSTICKNEISLNSEKISDRTFKFIANKIRKISHWKVGTQIINNTSVVLAHTFEDALSGRILVKVFGTNLHNCVDSAWVDVQLEKAELAAKRNNCPTSAEVFRENVFTPEGDGLNDVYLIHKTEGLANLVVTIMDLKTGNIIFTSTDNTTSLSWNGKNKNVDCAQGYYRVYVKFTCDNGQAKSYNKVVHLLK